MPDGARPMIAADSPTPLDHWHADLHVFGLGFRLADDPDPQVQMQLAYSLGEWKDPRAGCLLGKLAVRLQGDTP